MSGGSYRCQFNVVVVTTDGVPGALTVIVTWNVPGCPYVWAPLIVYSPLTVVDVAAVPTTEPALLAPSPQLMLAVMPLAAIPGADRDATAPET